MSQLESLIKAEIKENGPISVARYMELALGHPEHGYYMTRDPLGLIGDFITAPEISQMFGEMVGLWAAVVWQAMGAPERFELIELGPGRGTLMMDAMRAGEVLPGFSDAAKVTFVETSPVLRDAQKRTMIEHMVMPAWRDDFASTPEGPSIIIGNEFFDALPIEQYEKTDDGWCERLIALNAEGQLAFTLAKPCEDVSFIPEALRDAEVGKIFEHSPASKQVMADVAKRIMTHGGAALFFDYGHPEHDLGETLQAVKDHEYADVLTDPGEADITAHVDFEALKEAAEAEGAEVSGPVLQGYFLESLGMRQRMDMLLLKADPDQIEEIEAAYVRLTDQEQMGMLFKVMAVSQPGFGLPPWVG